MSKRISVVSWCRGITLNTPQTKTWSKEQLAANDEIERSMVFANFTATDKGRSRLLVATVAQENADYESNANLIAAAPDLLRACEFFLDALDNGVLIRNIDSDDDPGWAIKMLHFVSDLREAAWAVKKAKGGC